MCMSELTNINVRPETWRELNRLKESPDDTFDDVVQGLLTEGEETPVEQ